jgi:mono/diheme cytochrome c family protein
MIDDPAIGSILGPNLTTGKGGRTARYSMADWDRIVRHGVKPDGSAAIMPSEDFFRMSDEELSDIVAYTRAIPAVDAEVPRPRLGPIGKVLLALGKLPISAEHQPDPTGVHPSRPPETADSVEFGEHLAAACSTCHRSNFAGGPMPFGPPAWPAAANLTRHATGLRDWSYSDFERAITQGISKDGRRLREPMTSVVQSTRAMLPTERKALWTYLRSMAPVVTSD